MQTTSQLTSLLLLSALTLSPLAAAENVIGDDLLLCAPNTVTLCFEHGDCFPTLPADIGMPDFFVVDTVAKELRSTQASTSANSSSFNSYSRSDGSITFQGLDNGRAYSFLIHESTGLLTAAVARDGFSVSAFGSCTSHP